MNKNKSNFGTRKAEVLKSPIMKTAITDNDANDLFGEVSVTPPAAISVFAVELQ